MCLIAKSVWFLLHGTVLLPAPALLGSDAAKGVPLFYCVLRQGQSDMNRWSWAASRLLPFPSAWPPGTEEKPGSEGICPSPLRAWRRGGMEVGGLEQMREVPGALCYTIYCLCFGPFSPPSVLLTSETGHVWGFRLLHGVGEMRPSRTLGHGSGEWGRLCGAAPGQRLYPLPLGSR